MSPREAVCQYQGWDFSEAAENRYHYGRTAIPIYSTYDGYICAMPNGKLPPVTDARGFVFPWEEAKGANAEHCKARGKTIWIA